MHNLDGKYEPNDFEEELYNNWEQKGYFKPSGNRKLLYNDATTKCYWKTTYGPCSRWNFTRYINKI